MGGRFVACFSREYSARSKTYMNEELTVAIEELRQRPTDRGWFVPIKLSNCEIPDLDIGAGASLLDIQWLDLWSDWDIGVKRLVDVLLHGQSAPSSRGRSRSFEVSGKAAIELIRVSSPGVWALFPPWPSSSLDDYPVDVFVDDVPAGRLVAGESKIVSVSEGVHQVRASSERSIMHIDNPRSLTTTYTDETITSNVIIMKSRASAVDIVIITYEATKYSNYGRLVLKENRKG